MLKCSLTNQAAFLKKYDLSLPFPFNADKRNLANYPG